MNGVTEKPRILLIGKQGQVAWELARALAPHAQLVAADLPELDLNSPKLIATWVKDVRPHFIVNAAAYTDVEKAEDESELAMAINGTAPGLLAQAAKAIDATLIHYSTDYVFSGDAPKNADSLGYTESLQTGSINVYGKTKQAGEAAIKAVSGKYFIFRTSWVYGLRGKNFLLSILRAAQTRETLNVVNDQIGTPTWCRLLAEMTTGVILKCQDPEFLESTTGLYHLTGKGRTSWYGFAKSIIDAASFAHDFKVKEILPVPTSAYPTKAVRPAYALLDCRKFEKTFNLRLPHWEKSLKEAMSEFSIDCLAP
ncbi:MAG: dTDP-4-dehydrorhamnose reductase [Nitrospirae bacterium]|nr:dTDP-4-dehydrorhamnose reductase [Candidatus Manganitrophaceae bacterium]